MTREEDAATDEHEEVTDRGVPPVNRVRSMQARVSAVLAIAVLVLLGAGFLAWYYLGELPGDSRRPAPKRIPASNTETTLPPLARPRTTPTPEVEHGGESEGEGSGGDSAVESLLGPAPPEPVIQSVDSVPPRYEPVVHASNADGPQRVERQVTSGSSAHRERSGPAFVSFADRAAVADEGLLSNPLIEGEGSRGAQLSRSWVSDVIPTVRAQRLSGLRFLLTKGASIDCTLETAVDTALPSLVTCIAATDTYSADGSVVLIERGAKLFGETRSAEVNASARVFVVWNEVRSGSVVARLDSPATDAQGRGGLPGHVDRHFWARFGAAFLISLIDGGIDAATKSRDRDAAIVVNPEENQGLLTEVLRSTADIRPTKGVLPGAAVKVLIARDVDFSSVYELVHAPR